MNYFRYFASSILLLIVSSFVASGVSAATTPLIKSIESDKSTAVEDAYVFRIPFTENLTSSPRNYPDFNLVSLSSSAPLVTENKITCGADQGPGTITGAMSTTTIETFPDTLFVVVTDISGEGRFALCPATGAAAFADQTRPVSDFYEVGSMPYVTQVNSSLAEGIYSAGAVIPITVQFSENVTLSPGFNATLDLEVGSNKGLALLMGGPVSTETTTDKLEFVYSVSEGDITSDLQYQSVSALEILSGTIRDAASGSDALLVLPDLSSPLSLGANEAIAIANTSPVLGSSRNTAPRTTSSVLTLSEKGTGTSGTDDSVEYCPAIRGYWNIGDRGGEVRKIQLFLNVYEGADLVVDGIYGAKTSSAVKKFQSKYSEQILAPWGLSSEEGTGYWYRTTSKAANYLVGCNTRAVRLPNGNKISRYANPPTRYVETLTSPFFDLVAEVYIEKHEDSKAEQDTLPTPQSSSVENASNFAESPKTGIDPGVHESTTGKPAQSADSIIISAGARVINY